MAKLAIILTENVRPSLRGELTRWMIEPRPGVFVGKLSRRVREKLWDKICQHKEDGGCMIIYAANNEQRFAMEMAGECRREIVDFDGITLVRIPGDTAPVVETLPARSLFPPRRPVTRHEAEEVPANPPVPPILRPFQDAGISPPPSEPTPIFSTLPMGGFIPPNITPGGRIISPGSPEHAAPKKIFHVRMRPPTSPPPPVTNPPLVSDLPPDSGAVSLCPSNSPFPLPTPIKSPASARSPASSKQTLKFTPFSRKKDKAVLGDLKKSTPVLAPVFALTTLVLPIDLIKDMASPPSYEKGDDYQQAGKVSARFIDVAARILRGQVVGGEAYDTQVALFQGKLSGTCSCPVRRNCKHCVALCLEWIRNPGAFDEIKIVTQN